MLLRILIVLLLFPLSVSASSLRFDEAQWRRLAAADPLRAIEAIQVRLDGSLSEPERIRAHVLLGALLGDQLGDVEGGVRHYRQALAIRSSAWESADILHALGLLLVSGGRYAEARKHFEHLLRENPEHPQAFSIRATLSDLEGKPDRASAKSAPPRFSTQPTGQLGEKVDVPTPVAKTVPEKEKLIRVLVARALQAELSSGATIFLYDGAGKTLGSVSGRVMCRPAEEGVRCGEFQAAIIQAIPSRNQLIELGERRFRGAMVIRREGARLLAVNRLGIEQYLYGVLPKEVPHDWPLEALKAQAVAARTYALSQSERSTGFAYDVEDTVMSQVYGGQSIEQPATNRAVEETRGEIMRHNGQVVVSYFHSHSGGQTEDPAHVWGASLPYLVSRKDPWSERARDMNWTVEYGWREVQGVIAKTFPHLGQLRGVRIVNRAGERVKQIELQGARGSTRISGNRFRLLLDPARLKSTAFTAVRRGDKIIFSGTGYGHGVGLSQWGAKAMATAGLGYREILNFYYRAVTIDDLARL